MSAPQGSGKHRPPREAIVAEVLNVTYTANASIFGAPLVPNLQDGITELWTIYFAFDGQQSLLEHSLDNGANFATTFEDITPSVGYSVTLSVANTDHIIFRFNKNGTIIYIRVGQPI